MEAKDTTIGHLFGGHDRYEVPAYQRPYVWTAERQWEPLWDDIERITDGRLSEIDEKHFIGAIVLRREKTPPGGIVEWSVIDGQQRLTTLQIIMAAIAHAARLDGAEQTAQLLDGLLRHGELYGSGDARFRFWPTTVNQGAYRAIMEEGGPSLPWENDPDNNIHEAFIFFHARAHAYAHADDSEADEVSARYAALRESIAGLMQLVTITLEPSDPAQVIFETLNARGTPLLAMDLVKNALFAEADQAGAAVEDLNEQIWVPTFGDDQYWATDVRVGRLTMPRSEVFLFHWLTMKLGETIRADRLFELFRNSVLSVANFDPVSVLQEMVQDANIVRSFENPPPHSQQARFFSTLKHLDTTTMHPLALLLHRSETETERIDRALAALESALMRRGLMGMTQKDYNNLAVRLIRRSRHDLARADEIIIAELAAATADTLRWPSDTELRERLVNRPVYGYVGRPRIVLALTAFEMSKRTDKTDSLQPPASLELEHLMPQAWEKNWPLPGATDDQRKHRDDCINRIGNLTLVTQPLNGALSNAAWSSKRESLNQHSVLLMNSHLAQLETWDEGGISARSDDIARAVVLRWPGPSAFVADAFGASGHEVTPELVITEEDALIRLYQHASGNLRLLLDTLAASPTKEFTFSEIDDELDWPAKRAARVVADFERTSPAPEASAGVRPWRMRFSEAAEWVLWLDEKEAELLRSAAPQPMELVFQEGEIAATGTLLNKRLTVHSGSRARLDLASSASDALRQRRKDLLDEGVLVPEGDSLRFTRDYTFPSANQAISQVVGGSKNAMQAWKTRDGVPLGNAAKENAKGT